MAKQSQLHQLVELTAVLDREDGQLPLVVGDVLVLHEFVVSPQIQIPHRVPTGAHYPKPVLAGLEYCSLELSGGEGIEEHNDSPELHLAQIGVLHNREGVGVSSDEVSSLRGARE